MVESQVQWSDLPPQLWPVIGERLDTYIDVLRFRSVCRLWRDSLPKLNAIFPLSLPPRLDPILYREMSEIVVFRRVIYCFSPLDHHQSSNSVSSSSRAAGCWLAMIESTKLDMRFRRPIYLNYKSNSNNEGKEVNFLDFGIQEVAKSYFVGLTNNYATSISAGKKVVVFPDSVCIDAKNCIIVGIQLGIQRIGRLMFRKHKDTDMYWQQIGEENSPYDDVIVYKGKIYTVDREGRVFLIDPSSSMELVQFCAPMSISGDLKHLVECGGELYVVDRFVERKACLLNLLNSDSFHIRMWCCGISTAKAVDFKVHRLDQERGRWVEVKNLGNQAFVLGAADGFSVSAPDFEGFERNCIYFSHELNSDLSRGHSIHVFDLEKGSILKSSVHILKAPPIWLDWEASQPAYD